MNSVFAFLAPLALLLWPGEGEVETARAAPETPAPAMGFDQAAAPFRVLEQARRAPTANQVRIEQRVIIRIAPSNQQLFQQSMARIARQADDYEEERIGDCVPIGSIAAVYPSRENRLLLFMRDRRILSAALDRACNAQDFYSGFYVERSEDGQLCSRRDRLQSRAGASCRMSRLSRLVESRD